jgi:hypothetical protein
LLERYPLTLMPVCREPAFELGLDQLATIASSNEDFTLHKYRPANIATNM